MCLTTIKDNNILYKMSDTHYYDENIEVQQQQETKPSSSSSNRGTPTSVDEALEDLVIDERGEVYFGPTGNDEILIHVRSCPFSFVMCDLRFSLYHNLSLASSRYSQPDSAVQIKFGNITLRRCQGHL